jgi:nitrite reductase (NADH) large subunit
VSAVERQRLVVVGNGMAGGRLVEELLVRGAPDTYSITVFGDEPHANYNRILLSGVLAGSHRPDDIVIKSARWYADHGVDLRAGMRVEGIDLGRRHVIAASGEVEEYDALVIATGSRPVVPKMEGLKDRDGTFKRGAFVFRTLDDCDRIGACAARARRAVVIGGGLLGLEAAFGLLKRGLEVHVVHLMPHVMETQLDAPAGAILRRQLEGMGLHVHFEKSTVAVLGSGRVKGVAFSDGGTLDSDLLVIAAGIRPNADLAERAGLTVNRGIVVGDDLACPRARSVFAVGECAEHRGRVYGLVAPVWEQTQVLADRLSGVNPHAVYLGSRLATKLKVAGVNLAVMGCKDAQHADDEVVRYEEGRRGIYKKLILRDGRLVGAIIMGDGAIVPSLVHAFTESTPLAANRAELLFPTAFEGTPTPVDRLPDSAQVCDCNAVSKARIVQAVLEGARSLAAVCDRTRAGTGCGSCRPDVQALIDHACARLEPPPPASSEQPQQEWA